MFGRVLRNGAVLLVSLGVTVGCGSSDRPREIAVSDVQPCQLLSTPELRELPTISGPHLVEDLVDVGGLEGSTCQYPVAFGDDPAGADNTVEINTITNHGVQWQVDGPYEHRTVEEVDDISGFRTIRVWRGDGARRAGDACTLYLDVAEKQALRVHIGESESADDPATCDTAREFATRALKGLGEQ